MRKTSKPFLILFAVLLLVMSLPVATSERLRGLVAAMLSPIWEIFSPLQIHGKQVPVEGPTYKDFQKLESPNVKEPSADSMPARVIFRSPSTWNSSLWINIGSEANEAYSQPIIAKNSPVLLGDSIVVGGRLCGKTSIAR